MQINTNCPECKMISVFGHQPHLEGCSKPEPVVEEQKTIPPPPEFPSPVVTDGNLR